MADKHFIAQLKGYCLTTAEILSTCLIILPFCNLSFGRITIWLPVILNFLASSNFGTETSMARSIASEFAASGLSIRRSSGFWTGVSFCNSRSGGSRLDF